jgi:predicted MPP superfamily phosphohydrolase
MSNSLPYVITKVRQLLASLLLIFAFSATTLLIAVSPGKANTALPLPDPYYSDVLPPYILPPWEKIKSIIFPVLGRPTLVVAGQSVTALVRDDDGGVTQNWIMKIATHDPVNQIYTLNNVTCNYDRSAGCYRMQGVVPSHVPRDVFDLIIINESLSLTDIQINAVRVITEFKDDYRFVHLTDLHFGDPRRFLLPLRLENSNAPLFSIINQIFTELSFLDPEFILFSGDLVFGSLYYLEYPWSWKVLSSYALPTFMVPGNHDGYASGGGLLRDGLEYWQQIIGPPYYSFNYGEENHFVCINTYDGTAIQRNSISFIPQRWGGTLSNDQQEWLKDDLEKASLEGRNSILCGHHDPRGNFHGFGSSNNCADEDNDGYAEATEFSDALCYQEWNDKNSGEALVQLIRDTNASPTGGKITHFLLGHVHSDYIDWDQESDTWWIHTNSAGSSASSRDDFFGYRVIGIENARVVRVNRTAPEEEIIPPGDNDPSNNQSWDYQSYALNNIVITTTEGKNNGRSGLVTQEITNFFDTPVSGVLEFYMPRLGEGNGTHNHFGYHITGGTIRTVVPSGTDGDGNELVFYVDTDINPGETKPVTLEQSSR